LTYKIVIVNIGIKLHTNPFATAAQGLARRYISPPCTRRAKCSKERS